jgi:hypothetical protein
MRYFLFICITLIIASCGLIEHRISGNGKIVSERKNLSGFNSLHVSGSMDVQLRQDDEFGISISTDENLMEYIEVYLDGQTLVVQEMSGYNLSPSRLMVIYVSAPEFRSLSVSGSGKITGENTITDNEALEMNVSGSGNIDLDVDVPKLSSSISGSGSVNLGGRTDKMDISMSGSGDIHGLDLISEEVVLDISGSANAEVNAQKSLDVHVSGSGDVVYKGNARVSKSISGSGSVKKIN